MANVFLRKLNRRFATESSQSLLAMPLCHQGRGIQKQAAPAAYGREKC